VQLTQKVSSNERRNQCVVDVVAVVDEGDSQSL